MSENIYHLEIESNPQNLTTVEEFINYFSVDLHVGEEKMAGLLLSVTEATTNAIIHGNKCDETKFSVSGIKSNTTNISHIFKNALFKRGGKSGFIDLINDFIPLSIDVKITPESVFSL